MDASVSSKEINSKDLILYTNIDVTRRYLYNPDIENSELFYLLNAVHSDGEKSNRDYEKITIQKLWDDREENRKGYEFI